MKRTPLRRRSPLRWKRHRKSGDWTQARTFVSGRSGGQCEANTPACPVGIHPGAHAHHILMRSQGGGDEPANLLWVCVAAHRHIHDHPAESYLAGWLRRGWQKEASA